MYSGYQRGMCDPYMESTAVNSNIVTSKKSILDYLGYFAGTQDLEVVSEFDTVRARHICRGYKKEIVLLNKDIIPVPTSNGNICVEVFFCPRCRKLLVNSQSLEFY